MLSLPRKDIEFAEPIGYGAFGAVNRAIWRGADVAVKKLILELNAKQVQEFIQEAKIMEYGCASCPWNKVSVSIVIDYGPLSLWHHVRRVSNHPNVAYFCGVTLKPYFCIVSEYYGNGTVVEYLRKVSSR